MNRIRFLPFLTSFVFITSLTSQTFAFDVDLDNVAPPEIVVDQTELDEGRFYLSFEIDQALSFSPDGIWIELEETQPGGNSQQIPVLEDAVWMRRQSAGPKIFRARICPFLLEIRDQCGPFGPPVAVVIPQGLTTQVPESSPTLRFQQREAGADVIAPGVFTPTLTRFNAWHIYWSSRWRYESADPNDAIWEYFDMTIRWQTYQYLADVGRVSPIWLWAQAVVESPTSGKFIADLKYREVIKGSVRDTSVGVVELTPGASPECDLEDPLRCVGVRWRTDISEMYGGGQAANTWVEDTLTYNDIAGEPGTSPLPHDSYSGDWADSPSEPPDDNASLLVWIENQVERIDILFPDSNGKPAWALAASNQGPGMGMTEFCAYTIFDAPLPNQPQTAPPTIEYLGCGDPGEPVSNVGRGWEPVPAESSRYGAFWADLELPSYRPGRFQYASSKTPGRIRKLTQFHLIRPIVEGIDGATECVAEAGLECPLHFRWILDRGYSTATVFQKNLVSGQMTPLFSNVSPSAFMQPFSISVPGQYEFQVRRTSAPDSDMIARSPAVIFREMEGQQNLYQYDALGRLLQVDRGTLGGSNYEYDAAGNRVNATQESNQ